MESRTLSGLMLGQHHPLYMGIADYFRLQDRAGDAHWPLKQILLFRSGTHMNYMKRATHVYMHIASWRV